MWNFGSNNVKGFTESWMGPEMQLVEVDGARRKVY